MALRPGILLVLWDTCTRVPGSPASPALTPDWVRYLARCTGPTGPTGRGESLGNRSAIIYTTETTYKISVKLRFLWASSHPWKLSWFSPAH